MEDIGHEPSKRPRLENYNGSHGPPSDAYKAGRVPGPSEPYSPYPHSFVSRPPSTLPPHPNQPPPPSPYQDSSAEHRQYTEQQHRGYAHSQSGYNTPHRDARSFPQEGPKYSTRRESYNGGVTRSPTEPQQQQQQQQQQHPSLRPINTAQANEMHPYPPQYTQDTNRSAPPYGPPQEPLVNGTPHTLPMVNHHDPSPVQYPPPSQLNSPGPYSAPHYGMNGGYPAPADNSYRYDQPRKSNRATQACDTCRTRKAKCDEGKPKCGYCTENHSVCNYKEVAPAKAERAQREIMDKIQSVTDTVADLQAGFKDLSQSLVNQQDIFSRIEKFLINATAGGGASNFKELVEAPDVDVKPIPQLEDSKIPDQKPAPASSSTAVLDPTPEQTPVPQPARIQRPSTTGFAGLEDDEGDSSNLWAEHNVAAQKLLRWPKIKVLVKAAAGGARTIKVDYVMQLEQARGTLKPYGRGQGEDNDLDRLSEFPLSSVSRSLSGRSSPGPAGSPQTRSDDSSQSSRASVPGTTQYGTGGFAIPDGSLCTDRSVDHLGGLEWDGSGLKLDEPTVSRLYKSYMDNIHVMHPFIDHKFLQRACHKLVKNREAMTGSAWHTAQSSPRAYLNSRVSVGVHMGRGNAQTLNQPFERSAMIGIGLLIMALGKICEYKGPLPAPARDPQAKEKAAATSSPSVMSPPAPPAQSNHFHQPTYSSNTSPSPGSQQFRETVGFPTPNRRISEEIVPPGAAYEGPLNVDVIPGLAYYAHATDILGNEHGGVDVQHVQAKLLAGLYMGQLANSFESWAWIHSASVTATILTRDPTLAHLRKDQWKQDAIRFAYYTCLQLESDILAEIDFRRSPLDSGAIGNVQGVDPSDVAFPKGVTDDIHGTQAPPTSSVDTTTMLFYNMHIYLRRALNQIQSELYPGDRRIAESESIGKRNTTLAMILDWRCSVPRSFRWDDDKYQSRNINEARLRAKYYGAVYIIHRPFLYAALHEKRYAEMSTAKLEEARIRILDRVDKIKGAMKEERLTAEPHNYFSSPLSKDDEVLYSVQCCLQAAIRSTKVFDEIWCDGSEGMYRPPNRLIVTNIFGTAHAQFGNMLVLATTYYFSNFFYLVRFEIDKDKLLGMLQRTINFLRFHTNISPTLVHDAKILESVARYLGDQEKPETGADIGASFSSTVSSNHS
ncbi:hypothetical protein MMC25_004509 [Agyrium rufum]|nr:hypothetical protein [Agyrium rufum]